MIRKALLFFIFSAFASAALAQTAPGQLDGAQYLASPGTLSDKQTTTLSAASDRSLRVTVVGSSGGGAGTSSNFGATFPTAGTAAGFKDSTGLLMSPGNLTSAGELIVGGGVASGSADSGNPVKMGAVYSAIPPILSAGSRVNLQTDARGNLASMSKYVSVTGADGLVNTALLSGLDAASSSGGGTLQGIVQVPFIFNSTSSAWDRTRSVTNAANTTGTGIAAVGNMAQFDDVSPTTITENNFGNLRMSAAREAYVRQNNAYTHIATSTTTTVKSGAGYLHAININMLGTAASTATIYDNTTATGTVIAVLDTLNTRGSLQYDIAFTTGLTIVTTGTVAPDLTISWQ